MQAEDRPISRKKSRLTESAKRDSGFSEGLPEPERNARHGQRVCCNVNVDRYQV